MSKSISAAVIGCGGMGNTIIQQIKNAPGLKEIIGYDIRESQLENVKNRHQIRTTTNYEEVLADPEIKLVYIATDNRFHVPLSVDALRAGKAVMVEKPSGTSQEEIQALIRAQKETGGFLQVGLECRYSKVYQLAKEVISSGEIGKIAGIHFTYSMPPYEKTKKLKSTGEEVDNWRIKKESSGSMLLEKLCHYIDLVRWWNEGSRVCEFVVTNAPKVIPYFEIDDNVHVSYRFDNGMVSQLFFVMAAAPGHSNDLMGKQDLFDQDKLGHKLNYIITGSEGAIEIDLFQREMRVYHHPGKPGVADEIIARKHTWRPEEDHTHFHNTAAQNVDIIRRVLAGEGPSITVEDASETMGLCLEFEQAPKWEVIRR